MKNIYISLLLFGIFLGIIIYTYFNQLNKKTNKKEETQIKNQDENLIQINELQKIKSINQLINLKKTNDLTEQIDKILEITKPIDNNNNGNNNDNDIKFNYFNKKYDFITFTTKEDLLNKTHTLLEKIKLLTETHYMNCVLVIIDLDNVNDDINNIKKDNDDCEDKDKDIFNDLSLFVHKVKLSQVKDYYSECRFILMDNCDFDSKNVNNKNNLLINNLVLIGLLKLNISLFCNSNYQVQEQFISNKNIFYFENIKFKNNLDKFLRNI